MARSSYIYLVETEAGVVAAFTVKHEMETWCKRYPEYWSFVSRCHGGPQQMPYDHYVIMENE